MSQIIGNHLWEICGDCGKLVKLTGWLRGLHLCLTEEEIATRRDMVRRQQNSKSPNDLLAQIMRHE